MNYTKNYHLPQWVKEDRVLMEDFNQMCADMEAGLNKNAQTAAAANAKTAGDAASATAAAETRALARLRKLGYDLSQINARGIIAGAQPGRTKCLVFTGLSTEEERARTSGFLLPPDRYGLELGPQTMLDFDQLNADAASWVYKSQGTLDMHIYHNVQIYARGTGRITQLKIWVRNPQYRSQTLVGEVTCKEIKTNTLVFRQANIPLDFQTAAYTTHLIDVDIPMEAGHTYKLEVATDNTIDSGYYMGIGLGEEKAAALAGTIEATPCSAGVIQESMTLDASARMAMAVVHYTGDGPAPTVTAGGKSLAAQYTRQGTSVRGDACTEREYYLEGTWTGTVPLAVNCQSGGKDFTVHDVEFCLI